MVFIILALYIKKAIKPLTPNTLIGLGLLVASNFCLEELGNKNNLINSFFSLAVMGYTLFYICKHSIKYVYKNAVDIIENPKNYYKTFVPIIAFLTLVYYAYNTESRIIDASFMTLFLSTLYYAKDFIMTPKSYYDKYFPVAFSDSKSIEGLMQIVSKDQSKLDKAFADEIFIALQTLNFNAIASDNDKNTEIKKKKQGKVPVGKDKNHHYSSDSESDTEETKEDQALINNIKYPRFTVAENIKQFLTRSDLNKINEINGDNELRGNFIKPVKSNGNQIVEKDGRPTYKGRLNNGHRLFGEYNGENFEFTSIVNHNRSDRVLKK